MKKMLIFLLIIAMVQVKAQTYPITSITISLPANPDANTANWGSGTSLLTISAIAKMENGRVAMEAQDSKILVFVRKNGVRVCGIYNTGTAPMAGFATATKVWSGNLAISLIGQTCNLLPGSYELVVQFFGVKYGASVVASAEKTKAFTIPTSQQVLQSPQNLSPGNATAFTQTALSTPLIFKWIPLIPTQTSAITYRLKIWQLMVGQSNSQAMLANQPLVTKDVNAVTQTIIQSLVSGPCMAPYRCEFIWTVQALGADGNPIGPNNGTSSPTTFQATTPPITASNTTNCNTIATKIFVAGDEIGLSDNFIMQLTANPTGTNTALTGTGTVYVKWLGLLKVKFKDIKVNGDNKLCEGAIYTETESGQDYPTQWAINAMSNMNPGAWTLNKVHTIGAWIQGNKLLKPLVKASNQVNNALVPVSLSMPIGYFKDADENTALGFTEMIFKSDHAEFEVVASLNTEKIFKDVSSFSQTDAIALKGSGIYFTPVGLSGAAGSIKLVEPLVVTYSNNGTENLKLTFNKEANGHIGNGIVFSAVPNQFWKYNLDVNVQLPKEWLVPVDATKTNVDLNFQAEITEWNDFILQGNLPACVIPNSNGLGIEAGSITYDHSNISNAANMVFPAGYTGNTNAMFAGFYLKNFKLTLPDQLRTYADTTKKIEIIAENLIIDKDGITGKILANNVLNYPTANVGNLGASIDEVKVILNNSTLTEAKMQGKITLPLSSTDNVSNAINYSALFTPSGTGVGNTQASSIVFSLSPNQDITSKFLGDGKIQIDQTSSLSLILSKSTTNKRAIYLDIDLNGKLYYPAGNIIDVGSSVPLDLDLSCNFEHLGLHYMKNTDETFTFQPGHWSFASPQKKLSGFAFTITDVKAKIEPIGVGVEKQYLFKGGVEFVAKINIGSENSSVQISGDTKIALTGAIESSKYTAPTTSATGNAQVLNVAQAQSATMAVAGSTNVGVMTAAVKKDFGFLTQLKPKYLGVNVESIYINATMPALTIKGSVAFYKKDPIYGNGFKGDLQAKFTTLNMAIQAGAIFGNTKYIAGNVGNGFKYWKVEAQVNIPPPGIVFLTGLAFRGFGAGVYSRMNMTPPANFSPSVANASTFGGAVFTPDATVKMGFKVKAIIATTPKEETFNGSVALGAEFNSNGGMNFIKIDGLFNCGAKIGFEEDAFANGKLNITYDFPNKLFTTNLKLKINKPPITTPDSIGAYFFIDGLRNKWAFMCGRPLNPNKIQVFGAAINSYLMFGNEIETPQAFMSETNTGFANLGYTPPTFADNATSDGKYQKAKGFAFGLGVNFSKSDSYNFVSFHGYLCDCERFLNINYSVSAGAEINASFLQYTGCGPGLGAGWRAKAGVAVYAGASVGYSYSLPVFGSSSGSLGTAKGAAYAIAEFPNPNYLKGKVDGDFTIAGYGIGFHKSFEFGTPCTNGTVVGNDPGVSDNVYNQQNVSDSLNYTLINNIITPGGTSEISRITNFSVLLNYPYNEPFDVQEQQSSGQQKVRTFRVLYTVSNTKDSIGSQNQATSGIKLHANAALTNVNKASSSITGTQTANQSKPKTANLASNLTVENGLVSTGYDALGAKLFKQAAIVNGNLSQIAANALKANTTYKFEIKADLQEKINNVWQAVKRKGTNIPVKQIEKIYFKTNTAAVGNPVINSGNAVH